MSPFDAANQAAFTEAAAYFGQQRFTLGDKTIAGILNEFGCEMDVIIGGKSGTYTATLIGDRRQISHITSPIERSLYGRDITIDGRTFKITRCALDEISFTLGLTNPSKSK